MTTRSCPKCSLLMKRCDFKYCPDCGAQLDRLRPSDAPTCSLEVEISESRRRYVTIEVTPEMAERICAWTMKYNPTAAEEQAAIDAVKAAKVIKEEVAHDCYEIGCVEVISIPESANVLAREQRDRLVEALRQCLQESYNGPLPEYVRDTTREVLAAVEGGAK